MKKNTLTFFALTLVSSFSIAGGNFIISHPSYKAVQLPSLEVISEAEPGQNIVLSAHRADIPAIRVAQDIIHSGAKHGTTYSLTIPAGLLLLHATDKDGKYYRAKNVLKINWKGFLGGAYPVTAGVFVPDDQLRPPEIFYGGPQEAPTASEPHPGIDFKSDFYESYATNGFKRELVYTGINQNTVSIQYREFMDNMARPAFLQDLKYDLGQGDVIAYKGARFQIIKANNIVITYKMLRPLD